jgi:DNA topoisomerase-3
MKKNLTTYLCEKPSQASDLSKYLGFKGSHRKKNYYLDETRGLAVIHAVGHLFELANPEAYEPSLSKSWDLKKLPVLPANYNVALKPEMKQIFDTCKRILSKTSLVVISTDADNEGELIARDIIRFSGYKGAIKRALYSSTDKKSLDKAFNNLVDSEKTDHMAKEADLRRKVDWMVGMNLTMCMTTLLKKQGELKKGAFSVGRVITALALIVNDVELAIKSFKPKKYFTVVAKCKNSKGEIFDANLVIPDKFLDPTLGKCINKKVALAFADQVKDKKFTVSKINSVEKSQSPPLPYDLASLQIDMGKFEFEPDETLSILQGLYDSPLSSVTYPRTDCRFLPEGMFSDVKVIVNHLNNINEFKRLSMDLEVKPKSFNDNKVKVHHGIIPSLKSINMRSLSEKQTLLYLAISLRFCQQFMPKYKYLSQEVSLGFGSVKMQSKAIKVIDNGWKDADISSLNVSSKNNNNGPDKIINVDLNQEVIILSIEVKSEQTKSPSRFTPSSLVRAMEHPEKYIDDPVIKKLLKEGDGIGTSATRSDIIKRAQQKNLIIKEGKTVKPTRLFAKHSEKFEKMNPGFTALMQRNFKMVSEGDVEASIFIKQIENFIKIMIKDWVK